jgi:NAD-dependent dihydropyrimidine dehydrogenase PreA subunit
VSALPDNHWLGKQRYRSVKDETGTTSGLRFGGGQEAASEPSGWEDGLAYFGEHHFPVCDTAEAGADRSLELCPHQVSTTRGTCLCFPQPCVIYMLHGKTYMAYIIAEPCIGTKDTACVDACPVDCIHPKKDEPNFATAEMLYIDPVECIDCGACVPVCPVSAIFALDDLPAKWAEFTPKNAAYFGR